MTRKLVPLSEGDKMAQDLAKLAAESFGQRGTLGQRQAAGPVKDGGKDILGLVSMVGGIYGQLAGLLGGALSKKKPEHPGEDFKFGEEEDLLKEKSLLKFGSPDLSLRRRAASQLSSNQLLDQLLAGG